MEQYKLKKKKHPVVQIVALALTSREILGKMI